LKGVSEGVDVLTNGSPKSVIDCLIVDSEGDKTRSFWCIVGHLGQTNQLLGNKPVNSKYKPAKLCTRGVFNRVLAVARDLEKDKEDAAKVCSDGLPIFTVQKRVRIERTG
jgi:hypothetical protein